MKPYIYLLFIVGIIFSFSALPCSAQTNEGTTYIIPIKSAIDRSLLPVIKRGLKQAERDGNATVVFHMDTPGGMVTVMEDIMRMLIDLPDEIKTYTFIDKDALSAGALISIATDEIHMSPGSRIGASAVVTIFGDLPEGDMKEKITSSVMSLASSAANRRGHDKRVAEAMIRKDIEFKIGDKVICEEGKLLTLSAAEAEEIYKEKGKKKPLLSSGTAKNLEDFMEKTGLTGTPQVIIVPTWSEELAKQIERISFLVLIAGLIGIFIEIKTPGFGVPGLVGVMCLGIFFWGHNVSGLAGMEEILLFALGIILILVEIFLIPGFGLPGIAGMICIIAALLMAMVEHYPGMPFYFPEKNQVNKAVINLGSSFIGTFVLMLLLARFLPKTRVFQQLTLTSYLTKEAGYNASSQTEDLKGLKGTADTSLRPSGIGVFEDKRMDVVTDGDFIEKDTPIVIAETHGNRIVVKPSSKEDEPKESV